MDTPVQPVLDHLFRHEYGKLVSVLTKTFGPQNLELAEDVVQETLLKAMEYWKLKGVPENPSAWLVTAARNKAIDVLRRNRHHEKYLHDLSPLLKSEYSIHHVLREQTTGQLEDDQLRMMFVCCHPLISEESQVALILKTLCGFSVAEIASAFFTNEETISKRLHRARVVFREHKIPFEIPDSQALRTRLDGVTTAIYLLFNEGYHASRQSNIIRDDLVEEALRLGNMLIHHPPTSNPETVALLALMCLHAARLYGRTDEQGNLLQLRYQDRSRWDQSLIDQGRSLLNRAATGDTLTAFHLEAAIAYEHCSAPTYASTNWKRIDELYSRLFEQKPSSIIALQHVIVQGEWQGAAVGLEKISQLEHMPELFNNSLVQAAKAEWHAQLSNNSEARACFQRAITLSHSEAEQRLWQSRIDALG